MLNICKKKHQNWAQCGLLLLRYKTSSLLQKPKDRKEELEEAWISVEMHAHRKNNQNLPNKLGFSICVVTIKETKFQTWNSLQEWNASFNILLLEDRKDDKETKKSDANQRKKL